MITTYCGKSCENCSSKKILNCSGCKTDSGIPANDNCKLSQCCFEKGHESCDSCDFNHFCVMLQNRNQMRDNPPARANTITLQNTPVVKQAPALAPWFKILFWLCIATFIGNLLANDMITAYVPMLRIPGQFISAFSSLTYGIILIRLASEESRYRTAGIFMLLSQVLDFLSKSPSSGTITLASLLSIPAAVLMLLSIHREYTAHALVLLNVDRSMAAKWSNLWKWNIAFLCGIVGATFLTLTIPILGVLLMLGCLIGSIIIEILKLKYLYQTANRFPK